MKKKLFVIAMAVLLLAGVTAGTVAYFTTKTVAHNVITSGEIDIELVETWDHDDNDKTPPVEYPSEKVEGIMPGAEHSKIVNVKNTGPNDAWVRVKVTKSVKAGGETLPDSVLTLNFNTKEWIDGKDGYYYYNGVLAPGKETAKPLFTTVYFDGEGMGNDYQNAEIVINVEAYATQVANNGATVLEAKGWPLDIVHTVKTLLG